MVQEHIASAAFVAEGILISTKCLCCFRELILMKMRCNCPAAVALGCTVAARRCSKFVAKNTSNNSGVVKRDGS